MSSDVAASRELARRMKVERDNFRQMAEQRINNKGSSRRAKVGL